MEDESKEIKIPIKAIVENNMASCGCKYEEDEFNLIRKFFIACLNLGYLTPNDLNIMVNKFTSKIKFIILNYNSVNKMDYYKVSNGVLYISGYIKDNNYSFYEINFYKALCEVIWNANDNHIGFSNALCNIAAEKIQNMDVNQSRIIMPKQSEEKIGSETIKVRAGYYNYNLIISLLKQLFIGNGINENIIIKRMFFEGYDSVLSDTFKDRNNLLLLEVLDKITLMYINRKVNNSVNPAEKSLIDKYQLLVNELFTSLDQNYFAFCALITSDELRKKCMSKFELA